MTNTSIVTLTGEDGSVAALAPQLGGWLLRYARPLPGHGLVEALHFDQSVVDRYPREMYAGSPVLFPVCGPNHLPGRDHAYEWEGRAFELPQHGFARRLPWSVSSQRPDAVTLELCDSGATRACFPFAFRHTLAFRLAGGRLHWEQVVENRGPAPMPFAAGFHPYFNVPLSARSRRDECFVVIPECRRMRPVGKFERFTSEPSPEQNWAVAADVADTLYLGGLSRRELVLVDPGAALEVALNWEDAPQHRFAALWAKSTSAPWFCLEPWTALANAFSRHADGEIIMVEPGRTFRAAFWLEVRPMA
jgi:galactose mutarotase-like enzyme